MKIEKVNENQIRCTLTREDLEQRHIKLSELAYGTEKAKNLFQEMMRTASYEYGFESEDLPLMIEAVPLGDGRIVLIITKVDYPEELDTRFSNFVSEDDDYDDYDSNLMYPEESRRQEESHQPISSSANDILDLFDAALEHIDAIVDQAAKDGGPLPINVPVDITRMFAFHSMDTLISLSHNLAGFYDGINTLYKNNQDNIYYLVCSKSQHTPAEFNKVCNILTEYGTQVNLTIGGASFMKEHFKVILEENALQTLAQL